MSIQKLHYENISGTLVRREGLLSWRCTLCKAEGQSPGVMHTCPECGSKEAALPEAQPAPRVPDGVAEALQRLIENGAVFGPASSEDALLVARYRQRLLSSAPSVPEGWQLVPTAESRHPGIYKMLGALHAADNTPGMSEWESYRAMLAAAPEAKP